MNAARVVATASYYCAAHGVAGCVPCAIRAEEDGDHCDECDAYGPAGSLRLERRLHRGSSTLGYNVCRECR